MYQGFGKGDGGIIGGADDNDDGENFADVCESASAEESLICRGVDSHRVESDLMLSARLCPKTGDVIWVKEDSQSAIMQRTVGMSQMTSMLHDKDRNNIYEKAIQMSLCNFKSIHGRDPVVLDIGTGTGLLAMFAARHGAGQVIGCEMFEAMASIAKAVVNTNKYVDTIEVISAKSTSIESLLPLKPDILISELLDSALLGESCMYSHADAISRFMSHDTGAEDGRILSAISQRVMPHSAEVFATLIQSKEVEQMHDVSNIRLHGLNPFRDEAAKSCPGGWSLIPLQWPELQSRGGVELSISQKILDFVFFHSFDDPIHGNIEVDQEGIGEGEVGDGEGEGSEDEDTPPYGFSEASFESYLSVTQSGTVHGILLWWKVYLLSPEIDPERSVWYSTEPKVMNWQDHWLQVVFPLPHAIECAAGDVIRVLSAHDALRIWLKAEKHPAAGSANGTESVGPIISSAFSGGEDVSGIEIGKIEVISDSVRIATIVQPNAVITTDGSDQTLSKRAKISLPHTSPVLQGNSTRVASSERLMTAQCTCGWHLLCGAERIQCLNDKARSSKWEAALSDLLCGLRSQQAADVPFGADTEPERAHRIVLDVSDGSLLSIALALEMRRTNVMAPVVSCEPSATDPLSALKVISLERKHFSNMFHNQLAASNDVDEDFMIWDGEEWENVADWLNPSDSDEGEDDNNDEESIVPPQSVMIAALISECFYYQLHALPTWQALSFLYKRTELNSKLEPNALVLPGGAFIMAAAVELTDLAGTYGKAGIVSGYDHADLDAKQENWHEHMFPYKLGGYRKRLLTEPIVIATLDYSAGVRTLEDVITRTAINTTGMCDCIAVWVDYDLCPATIAPGMSDALKGPDNHSAPSVLQQWNEEKNDFPCHLKLNLKFFPASVAVTKELTILTTCTSFTAGHSDFTYDFKLT